MTSKKDLEFYISIVDSINNHHKLPELPCSKQSRNYYVKKLKIAGVINKIGYATWESNKDNFERFLFQQQVKKKGQRTHSELRGHNFGFTLRLPSIQGWSLRPQFLSSKGIAYKQIQVGFGKGQSILFNGFKVWLLDKSIVIHFPKGMSIWSDAASNSKSLAFFKVRQVIQGLESLLDVSLKVGGDYKVKLFRQSYGDVDNLLARQYDSDGRKLRVVHSKYGEWLLIDASKPGTEKFVEVETVHPDKADKDMDFVVKPFFNDLLDYSEANGNNPVLMSDVWKAIGQITANQKVFADNMLSHIEAIKSLSEGVKELRRAVGELNEEKPQNQRKRGFLEGLKWERILK